MIFRNTISVILAILLAIVAEGHLKIDHPELSYANHVLNKDSDTAFYLAKKVYLKSEKTGEIVHQANAGLILGKILFYQGNFKQASEHLIESSKLFQELKDSNSLAENYNWLGAVYQYSRQFSLARKYYMDAMQIFERQDDLFGMARTFGWLGHYYEKLESSDTAIAYQRKALVLYKSVGHLSSGIADVYDNLGSLFEDKGQFDSAGYYFQLAFELNDELDRHNNKVVNLNNLGDIERKTDNLDSALQLTFLALNMAKRYNLPYQIRSGYKDLSKTYALAENYHLSHAYLDSALNLYEEIFNAESSRRMVQLQQVYESERKEQLIATLEQEKLINIRNNWILSLALMVFGILGISIYSIQKVKLRGNRKLLEQKEQIVTTEQELLVSELKNTLLSEENLKKELENQALVEKKLRNELNLKEQSLTTYTLAVIRKNNFLEEIAEQLKSLKKSSKQEVPYEVNKLIQSIRQNMEHESDWKEFRMAFEEIHTDFFKELKLQFPELSPSELRLCALLKLNLNSNDIATILGVSQDSLRVARYRLRKKLHLAQGSNLVSYLMTQ